jgi:hypothetical protein
LKVIVNTISEVAVSMFVSGDTETLISWTPINTGSLVAGKSIYAKFELKTATGFAIGWPATDSLIATEKVGLGQ